MSNINLSDILEDLEKSFPGYSDNLEIVIDGRKFSLEDAQKEIEKKDSINSLIFRLPDEHSFNYDCSNLEWTVEELDITIRRDGDKGYYFEPNVCIVADYANDEVTAYSDRDNFFDVVSEIWDELQKEGNLFAQEYYDEGDTSLDLMGSYKLDYGKYYGTIEETLIQVYEYLGFILSAIATREDFYFRLIERYEKEDE